MAPYLASSLATLRLPTASFLLIFSLLSAVDLASASPSSQLYSDAAARSETASPTPLPPGKRLARLPVLGALGRELTIWDMVALLAACSIFPAYRWRRRRPRPEDGFNASHTSSRKGSPEGQTENEESAATDPGLLRKYSRYKSYTTSTTTYPHIRTFYRPHAQADKLPNKPKPLPLLVFVHGLGGSLAQFNPILTSLVNVGPCLGFDLPGCGLSRFAPKSWEAYSHLALVELVSVIITETCDSLGAQEVVLVCHSMGCSLAASLISSTSPIASEIGLKADVIGLVAICPKASTPSAKQIRMYQRLLNIPTPIFDLWRKWDRRGGVDSASVARFVGAIAHPETKKLQVRFNEQSQTNVWRRMASGALPSINAHGKATGGLPGPDVWAGVTVATFLVAGESDGITKPEEIHTIGRAMGKDITQVTNGMSTTHTQSPRRKSHGEAPSADSPDRTSSENNNRVDSYDTNATAVQSEGSWKPGGSIPSLQGRPKTHAAFKTSVLPRPAGHALLYDHDTYRTLSGLIQSFLSAHIDSRLSLGWQLQHLKESNKWDVKNLAKWQGVQPVSEPVADIFRAMKTLREVDQTHSPLVFVDEWKDRVRAVIDISHETPVYNPQDLDDGGIEYHKFATVSKIPPTAEEVRRFILLIDRLRTEAAADDSRLIGVHCHYGFNRTGFFICSYLIEREKYSVRRAIDEFQARRPPGIRHEHFLDALYVRYCVGLKRAPTL